MNIFEVETFLTIVRAKSISKAADMLYISQSATSQRLIALEKELGIPLIERRKGYKTIELTTKGEFFLPLAEKWYSLYQEMNSLKQQQDRLPLHIGAMSSINALILTDFYNKLSDGFYGIPFNLKIRTNWSDELYELLENRRIDIAIVSEQYLYKNIQVTEIFKEKMQLVMMKSNEHENRSSFHPDELDPANEIFLSWSDTIDMWHNYWWSPSKSTHIYLDTPSILPYFITDTKKWALFPSSMQRYLKSFNKFEFFEIESGPPDRSIFMLTHRYPNASKINSIDTFKTLLKEHIESLDQLYEV